MWSTISKYSFQNLYMHCNISELVYVGSQMAKVILTHSVNMDKQTVEDVFVPQLMFYRFSQYQFHDIKINIRDNLGVSPTVTTPRNRQEKGSGSERAKKVGWVSTLQPGNCLKGWEKPATKWLGWELVQLSNRIWCTRKPWSSYRHWWVTPWTSWETRSAGKN